MKTIRSCLAGALAALLAAAPALGADLESLGTLRAKSVAAKTPSKSAALPATTPTTTARTVTTTTATMAAKPVLTAAKPAILPQPKTTGLPSIVPTQQTVRAVYGDPGAFLEYMRAAERALHAGIVVAERVRNGSATTADFQHAPVLFEDARILWSEFLASYATEEAGAGEALVFMDLHDYVAFYLTVELMRPRFGLTRAGMGASSIDPILAYWAGQTFQAVADGRVEDARVQTRLLRERAGFGSGGQRTAILFRLLEVLDLLDTELNALGVPAGDALIGAMVPMLGALAIDDPCAPNPDEEQQGNGQTDPGLAPGIADGLAGLGVSTDDLAAQAQDDCIAAGGAERGEATGYGNAEDAFGCLGSLLGAEEEPTDYGMCMAAGLGANEPAAISPDTTQQASDCSNPLADGNDPITGQSPPPAKPRGLWGKYLEKLEEKTQEGQTRQTGPPEDEDEKAREEMDGHVREEKVVPLDIGTIADVVSAIADAIVSFVEWVADLFSSNDDPQKDGGDPSDGTDTGDGSDTGDGDGGGSGEGDDSDEEPPPDDGESGTTLPGTEGGGCQDPWVELAESCMERITDQIPGRQRPELGGQPGWIDPRKARILEEPPDQSAAALGACGGTGAPTNTRGCEQLTMPPSACNEPAVSGAAQMFGEQAARNLFCRTARCDQDSHCECIDGPLGGGGEAPGLGGPNPGDPVDLTAKGGPTFGGTMGPVTTLGGPDGLVHGVKESSPSTAMPPSW